MLEKEKVTIYWFSGTGNTFRIAEEAVLQFRKRDYKAYMKPMMETDPESIPLEGIIGLAFPVAIQSTFPPVWEFINRMPDTKGTKVFMMDTMEAFSGGIVGPLKKVLTRKGYSCIGAKEFKMSSSVMTNEKKACKRNQVNQKAVNDVNYYIEELIVEKSSWKRVPFLSGMMRSISKGDKIWVDQSKKITLDTSKCIKCKICEKNCPMECLRIFDDGYTIDHDECISCMRCVNLCPQNAFTLNGKRIYQNQNESIEKLNKNLGDF